MFNALIVVDVQKDFVEGGSLAVAGGLQVAHDIHDLIVGDRFFRKVLATKDWHNTNGDNGGHFHDTPDFVDTWPAHCMANTHGAEFAGNLTGLLFDDEFHKGWNKPAYSGFQGVSARNATSTLGGYLGMCEIKDITIVGIASTHCVKATVFDALDKGYKVEVIEALTVGVDVDGTGRAHKSAIDDMRQYGAKIT